MFDNVNQPEEVVANGVEKHPRILGVTASLSLSTGCRKHRDLGDQGCSESAGWGQLRKRTRAAVYPSPRDRISRQPESGVRECRGFRRDSG